MKKPTEQQKLQTSILVKRDIINNNWMYVRHIETERNRFMVIYLTVASALLVFLPNITEKYDISPIVKWLIIVFFAVFTFITFRYVYTQKRASLFYRKQIDDLINDLWGGEQNGWYSKNHNLRVMPYLKELNDFADNRLVNNRKGTFMRQFVTYISLGLLMHVAYGLILFQDEEATPPLTIKVETIDYPKLKAKVQELQNEIQTNEYLIKIYDEENEALKKYLSNIQD